MPSYPSLIHIPSIPIIPDVITLNQTFVPCGLAFSSDDKHKTNIPYDRYAKAGFCLLMGNKANPKN
jgi:hypothetical protein